MHKMREIIKQSLKIISVIFSSVVFFTACDNSLNFNLSLREQLNQELSITYNFYEYPDITSYHEDKQFIAGKTISSSVFPKFTHDDELLVGWQYLGNQEAGSTELPDVLPSNFYTNEKNYISSIKVGLKTENLYAVWKIKRTVCFDINNNDIDLTILPAFVPDGEPVSQPEVQERYGKYKFAGWYIDPLCNEQYDFTQPVTSDFTLYAKWVEYHTVRYFKNDGTDYYHYNEIQLDSDFEVLDCNFGERSGYGFVGWATTADGEPVIYPGYKAEPLEHDLDLYAVWSTDVITVTYIDKSSANSTITLKFGRGAHVPVGRVLRDNQTWYEALYTIWTATGKEIKGFSTDSDDDINNLPFDDYGGFNGPIIGLDGNPMLDEYNNIIYRWTCHEELTSDTTFYVFWGPKTYHFNYRYYDQNGNDCWFWSQEVLWNTNPTRPDNVPHVSGMRFIDWYRARWDGESQTYIIDDEPYDFTIVLNDETMQNERYIELIAKFESTDSGEVTATVTFVENPESDITVTPSYAYPYFQFSAPSGYISYKWYFNGVCISDVDYNLNGIELHNSDFAGSDVSFDVSDWPAGSYDLQIIVYDGTEYWSWNGQLRK